MFRMVRAALTVVLLLATSSTALAQKQPVDVLVSALEEASWAQYLQITELDAVEFEEDGEELASVTATLALDDEALSSMIASMLASLEEIGERRADLPFVDTPVIRSVRPGYLRMLVREPGTDHYRQYSVRSNDRMEALLTNAFVHPFTVLRIERIEQFRVEEEGFTYFEEEVLDFRLICLAPDEERCAVFGDTLVMDVPSQLRVFHWDPENRVLKANTGMLAADGDNPDGFRVIDDIEVVSIFPIEDRRDDAEVIRFQVELDPAPEPSGPRERIVVVDRSRSELVLSTGGFLGGPMQFHTAGSLGVRHVLSPRRFRYGLSMMLLTHSGIDDQGASTFKFGDITSTSLMLLGGVPVHRRIVPGMYADLGVGAAVTSRTCADISLGQERQPRCVIRPGELRASPQVEIRVGWLFHNLIGNLGLDVLVASGWAGVWGPTLSAQVGVAWTTPRYRVIEY